MSERAEALLISPVQPSSTGSGLAQRAFQWLVSLAAEYAVTLLVIDDVPAPQVLPQPLAALACRVDFVSSAALPLYGQPFARCVVLRIRMHRVAQAIRRKHAIPDVVLDMDDLESATLRSIAVFALRRGRVRLAVRSAVEAVRSYLLERYLPRFYSRICVANPEDLRRLPRGASEFCLPNRVALARRPEIASTSCVPTLAFIGTFSYFPNEDAALWIATEIIPRLRARLPRPFRVVIAGRYASVRLRTRLALVPEIEFAGEIESVDGLYREAHVALVPVRCGGGTKVKALEAVAFHCPIVATHHAMRGLGLRPGVDYLGADTAQGIAEASASLLLRPAHALALAGSARQRAAG